jgi:hypothetical protein
MGKQLRMINGTAYDDDALTPAETTALRTHTRTGTIPPGFSGLIARYRADDIDPTALPPSHPARDRLSADTDTSAETGGDGDRHTDTDTDA